MVSVLETGQQMHAPDIILWASKNTSRSMATPGCCTTIQKNIHKKIRRNSEGIMTPPQHYWWSYSINPRQFQASAAIHNPKISNF